MMVQQPAFGVAGQTDAGQQHQQQVANQQAISLAMPAIVSQQQHHQSAAHYSPQANFYQQQIIKGAQQFAGIQQQQQVPRLNGLNGVPSQQNSPATGQQQHHFQQQQVTSPSQLQESPYNGLHSSSANIRPAPIYAPRPTYYGAPVAVANPQQQQTQLYQQARNMSQTNYFQQQQQHSPSMSASVQRQLGAPQNGQLTISNGLTPASLSPINHNSILNTHQQQHQQQQQMQHLVMSYQQQQQQQQLANQSYLQSINQQHDILAPNHMDLLDSRWNQSQQAKLIQENDQANFRNSQIIQHNQQQQIAQQQTLQQNFNASNNRSTRHHQAISRYSDRDSVSTLSRFNQMDDRRSFTMRSQYTSANKPGQQFGFLELTGEAFKRLFGSTGHSYRTARQPLLNAPDQQMRRNVSLTIANESVNGQSKMGTANGLPSGTAQIGGKVTVIDVGEDYYFKRKVFKYQLVILRLINLLCSAFVLLSPVVMLLIPKMEPLIRAANEQVSPDNGQADQLVAPNPTQSNVITHAVGLSNKQHLLKQQQQHQTAQPQWRISECNSSDCDGPLIGFVIRLIMLSIAHWAIFFRAQTASLPRLDIQRCLLVSLAMLITSTYWLFFLFRVFDKRYNDFELQYITIINFAISMLEALILLHYLALVLLKLRQKKKVYCLKVVRSPDGESRYYSCGTLSIQECAQYVLEKYHRDFKQCSSYSEQLLEFENQVAHQLKSSHSNQNRNESDFNQDTTARASRSGSPAHSRSGDTIGRAGRSGRRSVSSKRRQSSSRHVEDNRSPSRSPTRSRSSKRPISSEHATTKSSPGSFVVDKETSRHTNGKHSRHQQKQDSIKLRDEIERPDNKHDSEESSDEENEQSNVRSGMGQSESKAKASDGDLVNGGSNSADQSSDATSRMKESSLETIRPANDSTRIDLEVKEHRQQQKSTEHETESVRSGRSRRSTMSRHRRHKDRHSSKDHHHHHHNHHRERSSSRADESRIGRSNELGDVLISNHHNPMVDDDHRSVDPLEEHGRKLRRRKLRLLATVEDAFEQIKRVDTTGNTEDPLQVNPAASQDQLQVADSINANNQATQPRSPNGLDAGQAARLLYPNIARPLQKYLRLTKQTGRHNLQSIYEHLSKCLLFGLSARAFLEKFTNLDPVWQQNETNLFARCRLQDAQLIGAGRRAAEDLDINSWSLVCDTLLSRQIDSGTFFLMKQGSVQLLVTVAKLPHLNLSEQVIDQNLCKFSMASNQTDMAPV